MKKVENTIAIQATAEKVWDALINPEKTKKYMFGCSPITDWKVGSSLLWRGVHEGNEMDFVTGFIKKIEPHKQLIYTVIDPFAAYPPLKRNHLNVSYSLTEKAGITTFKVVQSGFEKADDGEKRYQEVSNNGLGWLPILEAIKALVEAEK
jgi:uncharacterized protein YndB with AHSA1/START domain